MRLAFGEFLGSLFLWFAVFAALLTGLGIYGTLAYSVGRRSREFGIRYALGAGARALVASVLHHTAIVYLAGIGLGAFLALSISRLMSQLLLATAYADAIALVVAELALAAVAFAAVLGPTRRAIRTNPAEILRAQ